MLGNIPKPKHPDLLVGVNTVDDAGVFRISEDLALVQTVDFFTPIVDDPYTYGAIAVANSLSDVYAMGGEPMTALNIVCYPKTTLEPEILTEILRGGHDKASEAGCLIIGGHTVEDKEMKYGIAVTGRIHPDKILTNANAKPGDALVLTKPLGTGIITTAFKLATISDAQYREVTEAMLSLNRDAARLAVAFQAHACTDVTGFGLLGHAWGMANASEVGMILYSAQIPLFDGVTKLAADGHLTGGGGANIKYLEGKIQLDEKIPTELQHVLYDPQTSGGLLIAVSPDVAEQLVAELRRQGMQQAQIVGRATQEHAGQIVVTKH